MFHKATDLELKEGTLLEVSFQTGEVKLYDMASLFEKYPQLKALRDRELFLQGRLISAYGIAWNDELDIEVETIYESGVLVRTKSVNSLAAAKALSVARARLGISQSELSSRCGIDQSDISKIERGASNPSINTLDRIAAAMGMELKISFE